MSNLEITAHLLDLLQRPAFSVKDGVVLYSNQIAKALQITEGNSVEDMLPDNLDAYQKFQGGCLYLNMKIMETPRGATITRKNQLDIFVLDDPNDREQLRALSVAGQQLRIPLTNIIALLDTYFKNAKEDKNYPSAQIKHNTLQLHRMISNMCDADTWSEKAAACETLNITGIFTEIMEKSAAMLASTNVVLKYSCPSRPIYTVANQDMVERALLNMISNASKFADPGSMIKAEMLQTGNKVRFCVENRCADVHLDSLANLFTQYLRKPGTEDPRHGIGLGMTLIRAAATSHGGTVLFDQPEEGTVRVSMTLAIRKPDAPAKLRSPSLRISNYAGGYDLALLELSELLADKCYEEE